MLWQPQACRASIISASRAGVTRSPWTSQEMSWFWQNTQRRLQPEKKIVPEPFQPRRQFSSPKCAKEEATTAWRPMAHSPLWSARRSTLHRRGQTPQRSCPSRARACRARPASSPAPRRRYDRADGPALLELAQQRLAEGGQVARVAGGDDAAGIRDRLPHLLVDPVRPGVAQVGLDRVIGGHRLAADDVGLGQHPPGMADGRHRLERLVQLTGQGHHPLAGPELVRRIATRNHQRVELVRTDLIDAPLDGHRGTMLAGDLLAGLQADDHGLMAGVPDAVVGHLKLGVLEQLVKDERHSGHVSALLSAGPVTSLGPLPTLSRNPWDLSVRPVMARRQQAARVDGGIVRRAGYRKKRSLQEQTA